jgi:hypothetical protein
MGYTVEDHEENYRRKVEAEERREQVEKNPWRRTV